ncbi:MAG: helix-turn-helix transcriptional regulator [Chloroflexi bacterium]|nr:helix-turn-helix transcriptional regulator [Chloroflexota bacterium]
MTDSKQFAAWLKEQIRARGLTALKLAERLDVRYPDVLDWVDGWSVPPPSACRALAALFDLPEAEVLRLAAWEQR